MQHNTGYPFLGETIEIASSSTLKEVNCTKSNSYEGRVGYLHMYSYMGSINEAILEVLCNFL